jgi:hypothetical protein
MFNYILGIAWFVLVVYSLYLLITGKKPQNLNVLIWALLIIFLPVIGVVLYWIIERKVLK